MSKVKWLIEGVDDGTERTSRMTEALDRHGIEYQVVKYTPYSGSKEYLNLFSPDDCVVFQGTLQFAAQIRREAKWIPGVFYNIPRYNCTSYYPYIGDDLLNANYIMLPYGELKRRKEYLYKILGQDDAIFLRPDIGGKSFTGTIIYKEDFEKDLDTLSYVQLASEALAVVAEPVNINAEWRFVVTENGVVAGSQYKKGDCIWKEASYPQEAVDLANEMCKKYKPDLVWVIDICLTKSGKYKLLEIGCFSCCGLYECNRDAIVAVVSAAALKEWESYQCI